MQLQVKKRNKSNKIKSLRNIDKYAIRCYYINRGGVTPMGRKKITNLFPDYIRTGSAESVGSECKGRTVDE